MDGLGRLSCFAWCRQLVFVFVRLGILALLAVRRNEKRHRDGATETGPPRKFLTMESWRIRNLILAFMFFCWAVIRVVSADPASRLSVPVLLPALLEVTVGFLFARRSAAQREGDFVDLLVTAASLLLGAWMVSMAPHPLEWNGIAIAVFVVGAVITIVSLLWLGKSFAIFPAYRSLVTDGPYGYIRHPAYLGELLLLLAVALATLTTTSWILMAMSAVLFVLRIVREEGLIGQATDCQEFRDRVRYRLIPFIW